MNSLLLRQKVKNVATYIKKKKKTLSEEASGEAGIAIGSAAIAVVSRAAREAPTGDYKLT